MKKIASVLVLILFAAFIKIYDNDYNIIGYIENDRIYDNHWNRKGYIIPAGNYYYPNKYQYRDINYQQYKGSNYGKSNSNTRNTKSR